MAAWPTCRKPSRNRMRKDLEDEENRFLFLQNYSGAVKQVVLPMAYEDLLQGSIAEGTIEMPPYSYRILKCVTGLFQDQ